MVFVRELTLLWSKLQRRIDVSLESFIERCLQFGAIARTIYHLLFLIRVIQTEVNRPVLLPCYLVIPFNVCYAVPDFVCCIFSGSAAWSSSFS